MMGQPNMMMAFSLHIRRGYFSFSLHMMDHISMHLVFNNVVCISFSLHISLLHLMLDFSFSMHLVHTSTHIWMIYSSCIRLHLVNIRLHLVITLGKISTVRADIAFGQQPYWMAFSLIHFHLKQDISMHLVNIWMAFSMDKCSFQCRFSMHLVNNLQTFSMDNLVNTCSFSMHLVNIWMAFSVNISLIQFSFSLHMMMDFSFSLHIRIIFIIFIIIFTTLLNLISA